MAVSLWEYRAWFSEQAAPVTAMADLGLAGEAVYRTDTYFLPLDPTLNPKIRGDERFEVKRRDEVAQGLERWSLPVSTDFPMQADALLPLGMTILDGREIETPAALETALEAAGLPVVAVRKHRRRFSVGAVDGEITEVLGGGLPAITVAIEAADFSDLKETASQLGLRDHPNESYGAVLRKAGADR